MNGFFSVRIIGLGLLLASAPAWANGPRHKKLSKKAIKEGLIYNLLDRVDLTFSVQDSANINQKRAELHGLQEDLLSVGDESLWLEKHAEPLTLIQSEIIDQIHRYVPNSRAALFFASPDSPLDYFLTTGSSMDCHCHGGKALGVTIPVRSAQGSLNIAVVSNIIDYPKPPTAQLSPSGNNQTLEMARASLTNDLMEAYATFHESFHQTHNLIASEKAVKKIKAKSEERAAFLSLLEEGFTEEQTRHAFQQFLADSSLSENSLSRQFNERWEDILKMEDPALNKQDVFEFFNEFLLNHIAYQKYLYLIEKILRDHNNSMAMRAYIESGQIQPLLHSLGKNKLKWLSKLTFLYFQEGCSGWDDVLYPEMEKIVLDPSYSEKRFKSIMAIQHFLSLFFDSYSPGKGSWRLDLELWEKQTRNPEMQTSWNKWIAQWPDHPQQDLAEMYEFINTHAPAAWKQIKRPTE